MVDDGSEVPAVLDLPPPGRARGELRAAGTVLVRQSEQGPEIALVHRPRYGDWSLPKGKLRPDETWPVAAVRETLEETGLTARLGVPAGSATYEVRGRRKQVHYWVATQVGEPGRRIGAEVDDVGWFALDRALELLRHDSERAVAVGAANMGRTVPLVIARHAKAFPRKRWKAADADRPLAKRGNDEAVRLAGLLSAWAPARVVSSPSRRCLDSVAPYAALTGTTVELETALSEEGHEANARSVERLVKATMTALAREARPVRRTPAATGAVLCTHRPVLPTIAAMLGIAVSAQDLEEALPPAGCWVLHLGDDGSTQLEQHAV